MKYIIVLIFLSACVLENKEQNINQNYTRKPVFLDSAMLTQSKFFEVNGNKDTVLTGEKGTLISVPANAFVNNQRQMVEGVIKIELKEILTLPEMIFNNLPTVSNGKPLSSGGVIYINAQQNGESLSIAPHKSLYIEVPTKEKVADMNIYKGSQDEKGKIDWEYQKDLYKGLIPIPSEILDWEAPSESIECGKFVNSINKSKYENTFITTREFENRARWINYLSSRADECSIGKQVFSIYCDYLNKNLYQADSVVYLLLANTEHIKRYQQHYIRQFKQFYEERLLNVDKNWQNGLDRQSSEFANLYSIRTHIINQRENKKEAETQATYCFSTNDLGFINIDKLLGEGETLEDVYVQATFQDTLSVENSMVYLVLKNNKSVISSSIENGIINFAGISQNITLPPNEEAFLVAISHKENNFFFFSQKINNKQKNNITINFEAKKLDDIKSFLEKMVM